MENDIEILQSIKTGSDAAYKLFFTAYYSDLVMFANSLLHDTSAAEDMVQDFFIDFWHKKKYSNITTGLRSYVFKAVKNVCLNYIRNEGRKEKYLDSGAVDTYDVISLDMDNADEKARIYEAISQLPDRCKEIFTYCCVNGLTYKETAEELNVSVNTVRTQMSRAFKFLRDALDRRMYVMLGMYLRINV